LAYGSKAEDAWLSAKAYLKDKKKPVYKNWAFKF
jgi:hypothetical protein